MATKEVNAKLNLFDSEGNLNTVYPVTKKENIEDLAEATQSAEGLMSAADKKKLDGIAEGAEKNTVTGVKGDSETSYRTGNVNITKANVGLSNVTNESKATMFTSPKFTGTPTAPTPAASTNNTQIATTAFVQGLISSKIAAADAMIYKGTIGSTGATVTALPDKHTTGWTYKVVTAGTYAGAKCEVGDMIICLTDGTAAKDSDWTVVQANIDGAVTGPASATDGHIAVFDGATGKVIKDGGISIPNDAKFTDTTYNDATQSAHGLMTAADKKKLDGVDENANNYTHPASAAGAKTSGLYKIATDANGHVIGATAVAKGDITALGIPSKDTTYADATQSAHGLMSVADKKKLDGVESGATANKTYLADTQPTELKAGDLWIQPV